MKGVRTASRYAKALLMLAKEQNCVEAIVVDAKMIRGLVKESKDLKILLESPLIRTNQKATVLEKIFATNVHQLSMGMIKQILKQNRERLLGLICEEVLNQYNLENKIAKVSLSTATPLEEGLKDEILAQLKAAYQLSAIELEEQVDESLIGGIVMRMGDKQLDASIRRQLNDIKKEII
jgi:F-type H+-transporting ATPase subunit delta